MASWSGTSGTPRYLKILEIPDTSASHTIGGFSAVVETEGVDLVATVRGVQIGQIPERHAKRPLRRAIAVASPIKPPGLPV